MPVAGGRAQKRVNESTTNHNLDPSSLHGSGASHRDALQEVAAWHMVSMPLGGGQRNNVLLVQCQGHMLWAREERSFRLRREPLFSQTILRSEFP